MEHKRMWCVIRGVGKNNLIGATSDGKSVLVSKKFFGMDQAQRGDVIEFDATPFTPRDTAAPLPEGSGWKVELYAKDRTIIARYFRLGKPVARPRPDAIAWKSENENAADHKTFQEVR